MVRNNIEQEIVSISMPNTALFVIIIKHIYCVFDLSNLKFAANIKITMLSSIPIIKKNSTIDK